MDDFEEIWEKIRKGSPYPEPDPHFMDRFRARLHYEKIQAKKRRQAFKSLAVFCSVLVFTASLLGIGQRCMQSWMRNEAMNLLETMIENAASDGTELLALEKPISSVSESLEELWSEELSSF
ncbi:hypothetical protein [Candidatus Methylacidiphilum infernorum]|uniref:Uncharacterized protein n=1 Tax=Methylacidiphilum infernorum (isolate V4) TaxID=481448 RepID=B3DZC3_METI4|nr:hypothetical protein [Candidatus Methylacidiphilum infernorum]ACD82540.1 Hypothetical protein Minf_0482 [Methylacidiphilum infernorum V4]